MSSRSGTVTGNWILCGHEIWRNVCLRLARLCASCSHLCVVGPFLTSTEGNCRLCLHPLVYFSQSSLLWQLLIYSTSAFFFSIFYPSFYYLPMCLGVHLGDQNMICLTQSRLLSFLSEIDMSMSIEHSSSQKRPEGSLLMGTEVAWKGILCKEMRYMRSHYCLSPDSFHAAHSMWQPC